MFGPNADDYAAHHFKAKGDMAVDDANPLPKKLPRLYATR
jgi:hypothetical protein